MLEKQASTSGRQSGSRRDRATGDFVVGKGLTVGFAETVGFGEVEGLGRQLVLECLASTELC